LNRLATILIRRIFSIEN